MTFSIIGRCQETGQVGIAISSSSIAVGARCPWVRAGVGAVSTQNITLPALGPQILDALEQGQLPPAAALDRVLSANGWSEYRQVTVIDSQGQVALFTGREALGTHNAVAGEQCAAAGNLLSSTQVIEAMVVAFEQAGGHLADRLLAAMHAAMAAGGEAGPVHSAALKIAGEPDLAIGGPARGLGRNRPDRCARWPVAGVPPADAGLRYPRPEPDRRTQLRGAGR